MTTKKDLVVKHYKNLIEKRKFNEYDIQGLLIATRFGYTSNYPYIKEIADLIAHNKRDRGIAKTSITTAIVNQYSKNSDGKISGYEGFEKDSLKEQIEEYLDDLGIAHNEVIIKEITACLLSSMQDSEYDNESNTIGTMKLFVDMYNKVMVLYSIELDDDTKPIVFASLEIDCEQFEKQLLLNSAIELKRNGKELYIKYKGKYICKI